jgi:hypothetical protein
MAEFPNETALIVGVGPCISAFTRSAASLEVEVHPWVEAVGPRVDDPPHMPPNIYLSQQAQLKARAAHRGTRQNLVGRRKNEAAARLNPATQINTR